MPVLRTATGKEYICDFMGVANGGFVLYVQVAIDLYEALDIFQNAEETSTLSWIGTNGEAGRIEEGFTEFGGLSIERDPCPVRIRMLKKIEVNSNVS